MVSGDRVARMSAHLTYGFAILAVPAKTSSGYDPLSCIRSTMRACLGFESIT